MIRSCLHGLFALAVMAPAPLLAAAETESTRQGGPDTVGSLASLSLGLIAVIALIFGCAWLVKRMSGLSGMNSQAMKVVSVMNLGTRERIALLDVGGTQILVGITPSTIRTLHVFDEPVLTPETAPPGDFARRLQGLLNRQNNPPGGGHGDSHRGDSQ